jgi:hypothetical protein
VLEKGGRRWDYYVILHNSPFQDVNPSLLPIQTWRAIKRFGTIDIFHDLCEEVRGLKILYVSALARLLLLVAFVLYLRSCGHRTTHRI